MRSDRPGLRSRLSGLLPVGTRRRDLADVARRVGGVLAGAGEGLHDAVDISHARAPLDPRRWLVHHHHLHETPAARAALVAGPRSRSRTGGGSPLLVVIDARRATSDARADTEAALDAQWSAQWRSVCATTDTELGAAIDAMASEEPGAPLTVMRAGDRPRPDLVARVLDAAWEDPSLEMIHWDHAVRDPYTLRFTPGWSPDLLVSANAWGRSFALRAELWRGFDPTLGDAGWWSVLLAAGLDAERTRRLSRVAVTTVDGHLHLTEDGRSLVTEELARRKWPAEPVARGDAILLDWDLDEWPKVSLIIPTRHSRELLSPLLASIRRTEYPDLELVIVDNSAPSADKESWYHSVLAGLDATVRWWSEEFNYSAVNNHGVRFATGDVLVFLNDDTEARSQGWLRTLVGWATRPEIAVVGAQLSDPEGLIQHGGVVLGMDGSAGHLFAGMRPGSDTLLGHTDWVRNVLACTAATLAVRRSVFESCGGFDERFVLCGSDVALGLEAHSRGWRNVVVPSTGILHMESATRGPGGGVPADLFASWWSYQRWVSAGDPYFSESLSLQSPEPALRPPGEPRGKELMLTAMDRPATVFRQEVLEDTSRGLAVAYQVGESTPAAVRLQHERIQGRKTVHSVNWILPPFDNPFYGGLATIVRLAAQLQADHGVLQRFVICDREQRDFYRSALAAGAAGLDDCEIVFLGGDGLENLDLIPPADAVVATMWTTAYVAASAPDQRRRFYLVQDHEPTFYPAGTIYALAEETYRLGLYGICNSEPIHTMYTTRYGGSATWFLPAVDRRIYFPPEHPRWSETDPREPVRVFVYARPGHWRNCWEIAEQALGQIKDRYGEGVHVITAGSWASPEDLGSGIEHLGLLDLRSTAALYRRCDVGVALTVSEHPSYLPGELMACGVPVIGFDLPESDWVLQHERTGLRARQTVAGLREQLARLVEDPALRRRCSEGAVAHIDARHSDWEAALSGVWDYMCEPDR